MIADWIRGRRRLRWFERHAIDVRHGRRNVCSGLAASILASLASMTTRSPRSKLRDLVVNLFRASDDQADAQIKRHHAVRLPTLVLLQLRHPSARSAGAIVDDIKFMTGCMSTIGLTSDVLGFDSPVRVRSGPGRRFTPRISPT